VAPRRTLSRALTAAAGVVVLLLVTFRTSGAWPTRSAGLRFDVATVLTLTLGVAVPLPRAARARLPRSVARADEAVLSDALGHRTGFGEHAKLTWPASSLATVAGALGASLETNAAVCEAPVRLPPRAPDRARVRPARPGWPLTAGGARPG
jgi:hypothetical protein